MTGRDPPVMSGAHTHGWGIRPRHWSSATTTPVAPTDGDTRRITSTGSPDSTRISIDTPRLRASRSISGSRSPGLLPESSTANTTRLAPTLLGYVERPGLDLARRGPEIGGDQDARSQLVCGSGAARMG